VAFWYIVGGRSVFIFSALLGSEAVCHMAQWRYQRGSSALFRTKKPVRKREEEALKVAVCLSYIKQSCRGGSSV